MQIEKINSTLYKFTLAQNDFTVNLGLSAGEDGILLVDAGWIATAEDLRKQIAEIKDDPVKMIIFTHQHGDHIGGRGVLGEEAVFVAHQGVRDALQGRYFHLDPLPGNQQPTILIESPITIHFNGEEIRLIPMPGHTDSDLIVHFVGSGVCFVGDLLFSDSFPAVFPAYGGHPETLISTLKSLADLLPEDVRLIAGHGRDYTIQELLNYADMIEKTSALIRDSLDQGKTPGDMVEQALLADWEKWSTPAVTSENWIGFVSDCLTGTPRLSISEPLSRTITEKGVEAAVRQYHALRKEKGDQYTFGENELNLLGYNLLWREMIPEAIKILTLQAEIFPESANSYDSLGEVYEQSGDLDLARENYHKALEIDPEFPPSQEGLARIKTKSQQD